MLLQELFHGEDGLVTAAPEDSVAAVVDRMEQKNVGAVMVIDEDRKVVGIVTDRDVALALGMSQATPQTPVSEIMTKNVATIWEDQGVFNAAQYLWSKKVRRLPIIDRHDRLVGMVTFDDLAALLSRELHQATQALEPALHEPA